MNYKLGIRNNKLSKALFFLIVSSVFFAAYSWLYWATPERFNSPDETANYFWVKNFVQTGSLSIPESLNLELNNVVHPRSVNVNSNGDLVPGGFLGLTLLYGALGKIFGLGIVKFLTPLFTILGGIAFYFLVRRIFSERIAIFSYLLFLVHPALWYYAARGFLPNVLFLDLILIGLAFLTSPQPSPSKGEGVIPRSLFSYIFAGLFIGLALTVRSSEVVWVGLVLSILLFFYRRRVNWLGVAGFLAMVGLVFVPVFYYQSILYGSLTATGYSQLNALKPLAASGSVWSATKEMFLPFGFHPRLILINFWHYYVSFLSWYFIPMILGFILLLWKIFGPKKEDISWKGLDSKKKNQFIYLLILAIVSDFLIYYYGSWLVKDNINDQITIGTSYLRYWLPSFVLGLPLVVYLFDFIVGIFKDWTRKIIFATIISTMFVLLSINLVWLLGDECLLAVRYNVWQYQIKNQIAQKRLPAESIIINSGVSDKIFWPEFKVINWDGKDASFLAGAEKLVDQRPFYYYSHLPLPKKNLDWFNEQLGKYNLVLGKESSLTGEDRVYSISNFQFPISN